MHLPDLRVCPAAGIESLVATGLGSRRVRAVPELGIRRAHMARDQAGMYLSNQVTSRVR
jgi:hypothetical protein